MPRVTTVEVLLGLLIGTGLGAATAIQLSLSKTSERLLLPLLVFHPSRACLCARAAADAVVWLRMGSKDRDGGADHLFSGNFGLSRRADPACPPATVIWPNRWGHAACVLCAMCKIPQAAAEPCNRAAAGSRLRAHRGP